MRHQGRFNIFDILNVTFMVIFSLSIVFPFLNLFTISLSSPEQLAKSGLHFVPKFPLYFEGYVRIGRDKFMWLGYANTVLRTVCGTTLSLFLMSLGAYALSHKNLVGRNAIMIFIIITMFFNGGLIPNYIVVKTLGLINSPLSMILPSVIGAFSLIIMRNYFMTLPLELQESAMIDGASHTVTFFKIVLPLSKPILATVALWVAVGHWNAWFDCLLYITKPELQVVQVVLRRLLVEVEHSNFLVGVEESKRPVPETMKAAAIVITMLPILCTYPFAQKYFVKGLFIGSLKG